MKMPRRAGSTSGVRLAPNLGAARRVTLQDTDLVADREPAALAIGRVHNDERTGGLTRGARAISARGRGGDTLLEHFRRVYLATQPLDSLDVSPALGVTSALSGEGRTTVATGISAVMAMDLDV